MFSSSHYLSDENKQKKKASFRMPSFFDLIKSLFVKTYIMIQMLLQPLLLRNHS